MKKKSKDKFMDQAMKQAKKLNRLDRAEVIRKMERTLKRKWKP